MTESSRRTVRMEIEDMAAGGDGVGRVAGMVVFVPGGITGDTVEVEMSEARGGHARGRITRVIDPSPDRVDGACAAEGCGGCSWGAASYPLQLGTKRKLVVDALQRVAGVKLAADIVAETLPSPLAMGYRNRLRLHVRDGRVGFFAPGTHRLVAVHRCALAAEPLNKVLAAAARLDLKGLDVLELRCNEAGQVLAILWGDGPPAAAARRLAGMEEVVGAVTPGVRTYGQSFLVHRLHRLSLRVSWPSFFQVNPGQAERMYRVVRDWAALSGGDWLLDLYAGVGAAGLSAAGPGVGVTGIESSRPAVEDARENARANGLLAASFEAGRVERVLGRLRLPIIPAAAIINPPRAGCDPRALSGVAALGPAALIYVSCDPATLARDVRRLSPAYSLAAVQPVDMFPATHHVETVALLRRGSEEEY